MEGKGGEAFGRRRLVKFGGFVAFILKSSSDIDESFIFLKVPPQDGSCRHLYVDVRAVHIVPSLDHAPLINLVLLVYARGGNDLLRCEASFQQGQGQHQRLACRRYAMNGSELKRFEHLEDSSHCGDRILGVSWRYHIGSDCQLPLVAFSEPGVDRLINLALELDEVAIPLGLVGIVTDSITTKVAHEFLPLRHGIDARRVQCSAAVNGVLLVH